MKSPLPISIAIIIMSLPPTIASDSAPMDLGPLLTPLLDKSKLPSIAAAVVKGDQIMAIGAVGHTELQGNTAVTNSSKYHIGSCTKSMTATLAASLVECGLLDWQTTISHCLGDTLEIHEAYHDVTLEQLLAHTGGTPASPPALAWIEAWSNQGKLSPSEQRLKFAESILKTIPSYPPGTKTIYSNQGYAIVGVMLETLTNKPWERLMVEKIFQPLGMSSAGFREPIGNDQPRGHKNKKPEQPGEKADNPDAIAPAGSVHMTLEDWAKFARLHLNRDTTAGVLADAYSFEKLNATLATSKSHGVGGWLVHDLEWAGGHCLQAAGSNTLWFSLLWIMPGKDTAVLVATNSGRRSAFKWCDKTVATIAKELGF